MNGHYEAPFGWIEYRIDGHCFQHVSWMDEPPEEPTVHEDVSNFWLKWFMDPTTPCPYEFELHGTPFRRAVWSALQQIPLGETRTYKEVAIQIGSPKAQQAVGQACKANPITLLIPCHRVVGTNDQLTGYVGTKRIPIKAQLLAWEQRVTSMH